MKSKIVCALLLGTVAYLRIRFYASIERYGLVDVSSLLKPAPS